jgi:hypothetical protein
MLTYNLEKEDSESELEYIERLSELSLHVQNRYSMSETLSETLSEISKLQNEAVQIYSIIHDINF